MQCAAAASFAAPRLSEIDRFNSFQSSSLMAAATAACMRPTGPLPFTPAPARFGAAAARFGPAIGCDLVAAATAFGDAATERFATADNVARPALPRRKKRRAHPSLRCCSSVLAVAAFSSTSAEFCCVTSSICVSALLTCSMPVACSALALAMSDTISATFLIEFDDLGQRRAGPVDQLDAVLDLAGAVGDQVLDVLGRLRRALRQAAHLRRHHREAAAGLAGARRLDRGIERQQIGLPRDLVDHADDVGDLARGLLDPRHRAHRLAPPPAPPRSATSRVPLADWLACWAFSAFFFTVAEISSIEAEVSLQARGLLLGALREVGRAGRDLGRGVGDLAGRAAAIEPIVSCSRAIAVLKSSLIWR